MDYTELLGGVIDGLLKVWWMFPVVLAVAVARLPVVKGWLGELLVRVSARWLLNPNTYRAHHDLTIPAQDGTTQIDHVLVSPFGVFAIETKNLQGWIFGSERQAQWTQKIYRKSFKFQNPLRQNYQHTRALGELLGLPDEAIHSVVVFTGASTFKTHMPNNVRQGAGYIRYIRSFRQSVLTGEQIAAICDQLDTGRYVTSRTTRRAHREQVAAKKLAAEGRACSRCGADMLLRTAKRGRNAGQQFWGCSRFPECRFMQKA